jgi:molecular chaperone DnaK
VPQIEVTFDIDANGIVNVSARDKGTGREQKITIHPSSGLSKDQIDKMVNEAESHAADDKRRKEEVEERNLADSAAYRSEKSLSELGDKVSSEQKGELETKIADVRAALATDDISRIKSAREALEQAFYRVSESMYQQQGAAPGGDYAGGAQPEGEAGAGSRDDTIEGEYKEM